METIAHLSDGIENQVLADFRNLQDFVATQLGLMVRQKIDDAALNGDGTGAIEGILEVDGTIPIDSTDHANSLDAVFAAAQNVREANLEPDAIVMHPVTWTYLRTLKSVAGTGGYFVSPDVQAGERQALFGLPIAQVNACPKWKVVVGAFKEATTWFERDQRSVRIFETGQDENGDDLVEHSRSGHAPKRAATWRSRLRRASRSSPASRASPRAPRGMGNQSRRQRGRRRAPTPRPRDPDGPPNLRRQDRQPAQNHGGSHKDRRG
jgi:Phage capsid family